MNAPLARRRLSGDTENRAYHHGNLRTALVLCGLRLLEREGIGGLTLRRAAREAGVSQSAPLHHFGNKLGLCAAIAAEGFRALLASRRDALAREKDAEGRLRAVMRAYVRFALRHPALFELMFSALIPDKSKYPELEDAATRSYRLLEDCVGEYLRACGGSAATARQATLAAWTTCHGVATILVDRQNSPTEVTRRRPNRFADDVFDVLLAGIALCGSADGSCAKRS